MLTQTRSIRLLSIHDNSARSRSERVWTLSKRQNTITQQTPPSPSATIGHQNRTEAVAEVMHNKATDLAAGESACVHGVMRIRHVSWTGT